MSFVCWKRLAATFALLLLSSAVLGQSQNNPFKIDMKVDHFHERCAVGIIAGYRDGKALWATRRIAHNRDHIEINYKDIMRPCETAGSASGQKPTFEADPRALAAVERSRTTRQPYTVILAASVEINGSRFEDRATEFHDWPLHRVETKLAHVIANCESLEAVRFDTTTFQSVRSEEDASSACGVGGFEPDPRKLKWLGRERRIFGWVDVIELENAQFFRRYEITGDGIIVLSNFEPKDGKGFRYTTKFVKLDRRKPPPSTFDQSTIARRLGL